MAARKKTSKKKTSKKKAVRKKTAGKKLISMADLEKQLGVEAAEIADKEVNYGSMLVSTKGKRFTINETQLPDPLRVVIVAHSYVNSWYDRPYDPNEGTVPACFAIQEEPLGMVPLPSSPSPQAPACAECEWDKFGTAQLGSGKACRNNRRLVIMLVDDESEDPQLATIHIPPSGIVSYSKYVKGLAKIHKRPPHGVVTDLSFMEESDQPVTVCSLVSPISDVVLLQRVMGKRKEALELALQPYDTSGYQKPTGAKKRAKKKAAKKRTRKARY